MTAFISDTSKHTVLPPCTETSMQIGDFIIDQADYELMVELYTEYRESVPCEGFGMMRFRDNDNRETVRQGR